MQSMIERIKQKVFDKAIELNPVISIETIREFERINSITLPDELASFYAIVGNGGTMLNGFPLKGFEELKIDISKVKEEFPFTNYWIWESNPVDGNIEYNKRKY